MDCTICIGRKIRFCFWFLLFPTPGTKNWVSGNRTQTNPEGGGGLSLYQVAPDAGVHPVDGRNQARWSCLWGCRKFGQTLRCRCTGLYSGLWGTSATLPCTSDIHPGLRTGSSNARGWPPSGWLHLIPTACNTQTNTSF